MKINLRESKERKSRERDKRRREKSEWLILGDRHIIEDP